MFVLLPREGRLQRAARDTNTPRLQMHAGGFWGFSEALNTLLSNQF